MSKKEEWESLIGHKIRNDTYIFMERMIAGEDYKEIYKDIENNKLKYGLKKDVCLTKEKTVHQMLSIVGEVATVENKEEQQWSKQTGIYGIYVDDKLIYVGKTLTAFRTRFLSHRRKVNDVNENGRLYAYLRKAKANNQNIVFKPIIIVENLLLHKNTIVKDRDLAFMELALIDLYKPICNTQGVYMNYSIKGFIEKDGE